MVAEAGRVDIRGPGYVPAMRRLILAVAVLAFGVATPSAHGVTPGHYTAEVNATAPDGTTASGNSAVDVDYPADGSCPPP